MSNVRVMPTGNIFLFQINNVFKERKKKTTNFEFSFFNIQQGFLLLGGRDSPRIFSFDEA